MLSADDRAAVVEIPARDEGQPAGFLQAVTPTLKRLTLALAVAAVPTILVFVPTIAGVSTWKWVLGIVGLMIFVLAGRQGRP
jgi:hypothetical protein